MGSASLLTQFELSPAEFLAVSAEDLKDFYYFYKVNESRSRRNAIKCILHSSEIRSFRCFAQASCSPSDRYVPCLATMAMGDRNAVEYGQQSHVRLGLDFGIFSTQDLITLRGRIPRDQRFAVGIVIDDLIMLEKITSASSIHEPSPASIAADDMVKVYTQVGLKPNDAKRIRHSLKTDFWGAQLDGRRGLVAAQPQRVLPVTLITCQVARLGCGSKKLLEILAGAWTAIAQLRKRCMCLLDVIFDEISAHEYGEIFPLSEQLVAELWSLAVLAPVMVTDLRAQTSGELSMVDASSGWKAEVSCELPESFAKELNRHALTKSIWARVLSPWKALQRVRGVLDPEDELPAETLRAHPVWSTLAVTQQYLCQSRKRIKGIRHINLSELDALLECEVRRSQRSPSSRLHIASDSQVVCGTMVKGRSSSKCLNSRLRRALPSTLGFGSYVHVQYVQSALNPADDPTRDREVRAASQPPPDWLVAALGEDYSAMDTMLAEHKLDDQSASLLPVYTAPGIADIQSLSDRELRRRSYFADRSRQGGKTKVAVSPPAARVEPWMPRTALSDRALELLSALPNSQFVFPRGTTDKTLRQRGHLDLFSGSRGAARALANKTGQWVLTYDIKNSSRENLLCAEIQKEIELLIEADCFHSLGAGPVCASFSRAVRPAVRSRLCPYGLPQMTEAMQKKVEQGNVFAVWLAALTSMAYRKNLIIWIENPWLSFLWDLDEWQTIASLSGFGFFLVDYTADSEHRGENVQSSSLLLDCEISSTFASVDDLISDWLDTQPSTENLGRVWPNPIRLLCAGSWLLLLRRL